MNKIFKEHIISVAKTGIPVIRRYLSGDKRWMVYAPPDYQGTVYKSGLIYEHRLIMEYFLGRNLHTNEIVHHKDGNKRNNKFENLELLSRAIHTALHAPKPKVVILKCDYCGELFSREKRRTYKGYKHNFCSLSHSVKFQMREKYQTTIIKHGTQSGYRHGCRCKECKMFHNKRIREYQRSKKK